MVRIVYGDNKETNFYIIDAAIKFAYNLWKNNIPYKYTYKSFELIEHNSWDFIELEKCLEVQIELIDKLIDNNIIKSNCKSD